MSKKIWFTVEIVFNNREETRMFHFKNCSSITVHKLREQVVNEGLQLPHPDLADVWIVILPLRVTAFTVYKQSKFFYEDQSSFTSTVFSENQTVKP